MICMARKIRNPSDDTISFEISDKHVQYVLLFLAFAILAWSILSLAGSTYANTPENFQKALSSEQPDKCKTPSGYTDEQWRTHMGHHPDLYAECLK